MMKTKRIREANQSLNGFLTIDKEVLVRIRGADSYRNKSFSNYKTMIRKISCLEECYISTNKAFTGSKNLCHFQVLEYNAHLMDRG